MRLLPFRLNKELLWWLLRNNWLWLRLRLFELVLEDLESSLTLWVGLRFEAAIGSFWLSHHY